MAKGSSYPELTTVIPNDLLIGIDTTSNATKNIKVSTIMTAIIGTIYPVGGIYTSTNSANPATTFGFGTWEAFGEGRVLVGKAASGTFATAGATGGEETHALTENENGVHSHGVNDPGHSHGFPRDVVVTAASGTNRTGTSGQQLAWSVMGSTNAAGTGIWLNNSGSGTPHNNLQPYVVVYMWKRTA